jgi:hypothetical protein
MGWREVAPQGDLVQWDEAKTLEGTYIGPRRNILTLAIISCISSNLKAVKYYRFSAPPCSTTA